MFQILYISAPKIRVLESSRYTKEVFHLGSPQVIYLHKEDRPPQVLGHEFLCLSHVTLWFITGL
jgi:hypothetical protein